MKKLLCILFGHRPISDYEKDMFGYEYVWQKIHCERCGKRLN